MQFNSPEQLELARRVLKAYNHDWSRILRDATYEGGGVLRIRPAPLDPTPHPTETPRIETTAA